MSEDLIERLRARGKVKDFQPGLPVCIEAAAEIERLRAKLAKAEAARDAVIAIMDSAIASAEAAEKRLASAKEVIAPFAERYREAMRVKAAKHAVSTNAKVSDLRAAAEWMEKGDE
ncbi:hypothetical protein [uncultured Nitratireductor sp.]|uniref:hypothetical protein n=1 Tax=uncultured Nitratireductor sp. TaxID=520953 RepID=UPI002614B6FF|nr:hypothetical protein [uncultured Nitratireductor sp.]